MSIIKMVWRPTTASVEKKNRKWELASAVMDIWRIAETIEDPKLKQQVMSILLRVL